MQNFKLENSFSDVTNRLHVSNFEFWIRYLNQKYILWFYKLNFQTQLVLTSNQGIIHQLQSLEEIQVLNQRGRALQAHRGQEKHHFKNDVSKWNNQETKILFTKNLKQLIYTQITIFLTSIFFVYKTVVYRIFWGLKWK